jgi:hypothetical protein
MSVEILIEKLYTVHGRPWHIVADVFFVDGELDEIQITDIGAKRGDRDWVYNEDLATLMDSEDINYAKSIGRAELQRKAREYEQPNQYISLHYTTDLESY